MPGLSFRMTTGGWLRLPFGLVCLAALGCGGDSSPTAPSTVTANLAGTWAGSGRAQQCTPPSSSPTLCQGTVGTDAPLELRLTQSGTAVTGTVSVNAGDPVSIAGAVAAGGTASLSGRQTLPNGSTVSIDSAQLTVVNTAMSGTITYSVTPSPTSGTLAITLGLQNVTRR